MDGMVKMPLVLQVVALAPVDRVLEMPLVKRSPMQALPPMKPLPSVDRVLQVPLVAEVVTLLAVDRMLQVPLDALLPMDRMLEVAVKPLAAVDLMGQMPMQPFAAVDLAVKMPLVLQVPMAALAAVRVMGYVAVGVVMGDPMVTAPPPAVDESATAARARGVMDDAARRPHQR